MGFEKVISGVKNVMDVVSPIANTALAGWQYRDQKKRADSSHQREVQDLIKAGLNPILSAGGKGLDLGQTAQFDTGAKSSSSAKEYGELKMQKDVRDKMYYDAVASGAQADILTKQAQIQEQEAKAFPLILQERIRNQVLTNATASAQAAKLNADKTATELDNVEREAGADIYSRKGIRTIFKSIKELFR